MTPLYIDAHCHLHSFNDERIHYFLSQNFFIIAVSEDLNSSIRSIELSKLSSRIYPCIGIHPWEFSEETEREINRLSNLINEISCLGEIGLDYRYGKVSKEKQICFFKKLIRLAVEYDLKLNLHALDSWRDVFNIIVRFDIKKAIFHWYSGPIDLLKDFESKGYFITINPCVRFQKKHSKVLQHSPLSIILTESDGPYEYKGVSLEPNLIPELINYISDVKEISRRDLLRIIVRNVSKFLDMDISKLKSQNIKNRSYKL